MITICTYPALPLNGSIVLCCCPVHLSPRVLALKLPWNLNCAPFCRVRTSWCDYSGNHITISLVSLPRRNRYNAFGRGRAAVDRVGRVYTALRVGRPERCVPGGGRAGAEGDPGAKGMRHRGAEDLVERWVAVGEVHKGLFDECLSLWVMTRTNVNQFTRTWLTLSTGSRSHGLVDDQSPSMCNCDVNIGTVEWSGVTARVVIYLEWPRV